MDYKIKTNSKKFNTAISTNFVIRNRLANDLNAYQRNLNLAKEVAFKKQVINKQIIKPNPVKIVDNSRKTKVLFPYINSNIPLKDWTYK